MKRIELAYLAGMFDGEGSIIIHKHKAKKSSHHDAYVVEACLGNTNEWIVRQFQFSFGGNVYLRKKQTEQTQAIWAWQISANKAIPFLTTIIPFLKLKKTQAEIGLKFQESKSKKRRAKPVSQEELTVAEAAKILISNLNKGTKKPESEGQPPQGNQG